MPRGEAQEEQLRVQRAALGLRQRQAAGRRGDTSLRQIRQVCAMAPLPPPWIKGHGVRRPRTQGHRLGGEQGGGQRSRQKETRNGPGRESKDTAS